MFTILLIGQKGGTGKTTVATTLSVAAGRAGLAALLIDLDPQANASNWKDRRQHDDGSAVIAIPPSHLPQTLKTAQENGAEVAVIDAPGKQDSTAIEAARCGSGINPHTTPNFRAGDVGCYPRPVTRRRRSESLCPLERPASPGQKSRRGSKAMIQPNFGFPTCPVHLCQLLRIHGQEFNSFRRKTRSKALHECKLHRQEKFLYICDTLHLWEWEIR